MERMPYQPDLDPRVPPAPGSVVLPAAATSDWRHGLPSLHGTLVTLRELRVSDAGSLFAAMNTEDVARFISPPPTTVEGFAKFIAWTIHQRASGQYVCFAVVVRGTDTAVGLFQIRSLDTDFSSSEWGFALAVEYWGTGLFVDAAQLAVDFAFTVLGAQRLEARAALKNGRGNGALRKLGATQEGILRRSLLRQGEYHDQALWTILADDWLISKAVWGPRIVH